MPLGRSAIELSVSLYHPDFLCKPTPVTVLSIETPMDIFCITFLKAFTDPLPELSSEQRTDSPCLANPSLILLPTKKTVTSQGPVFARSCEQRTENTRVENSVITPVNMHPEGCDLIGSFFMSEGFVWEVLFLSFVANVV